MKQDDFKPIAVQDDPFTPTPGKDSKQTFEKEKTIAKTKMTWRFGFHIIGKWYMLLMASLVVGVGFLFVQDAAFQSLFVLLLIAYVVIVGLTLASTPTREVILTDRRLLFKATKAEGKAYDIAFDRILNIIPRTPTLGHVFHYGFVDILLDDEVNIDTIRGVEDHDAFCEKARQALIDHANAKRDHEKIVQREKARHAMAKK